jgi:lysine N6-hydroxylase
MREIHDFAAVGIGPFNLGLACLTAPIAGLHGAFLDKNPGFDWHPGMLLQDVRLQTPFLSDLVTLADPTSPFSFLNYIKQQGRIYSFYIRENFFLLRNEYNQYCQWAAGKLTNLEFDTRVEQIDYDRKRGCYTVKSVCMKTGAIKVHRAAKLVLGTGPVPYVPECCRELGGRAIHSSEYLGARQDLQQRKSITVLGSGQSAAEIYYDLLQEIDRYGYELNWITRSPRFFPLEYSKLTLEMTSPEYVDYFYHLPAGVRERLVREQKNLYKGINTDLINAIYDLLYIKRLNGDIKVNLLTHSELKKAAYDRAADAFDLEFLQVEQDRHYRHRTQALVLATGYTGRIPGFLDNIAGRIQWDDKGRFRANRNYSIDHNGCEIFVQNAELYTHGFVTPDLGMACYRNSCIIREMTGREYYPLERRVAFQQFAAPEAGAPQSARPDCEAVRA